MINFIADGLQSLATRLGTSADKAATVSYATSALDHEQLRNAFRSSWSMKKVVKIPAFDAARKWRQWSGDSAEEIEALEVQFNLRAKVQEAHWKSRLWGGACILIGIGDEPLDQPVDVRSVKKDDLRYLTVLTPRVVSASNVVIDPRGARYGRPSEYQISTQTGKTLKVHPSRLAEFIGEPMPQDFEGAGSQYGWGDSVLQAVYTSCLHMDSTMANIAGLVFDAKTDVIRIPGLTSSITRPEFEEALFKRFSTARMLKGNNGTLILDKEEEYESKSYTFSGLDKIADRFMQVASGASDIPMTRFLGMSPAGLSSTGESDLNNYYDRISAMQELDIQPALTVLDEVIVRSAVGDRPEDATYDWRPLKQMTEAQISEIRSRDADTIGKLAASRVFDDSEIADMGAEMFTASGIDSLSVSEGEVIDDE